MDTLARSSSCCHARLRITSLHPTEFVDITDRLSAWVRASGVDTGHLNVQSLHTTAAVVVNEHEPLLLADFESLLERTAPCHGTYGHDDLSVRDINLMPNERRNGHAHCRALLLPASASLNVVGARLVLGRWQRVFLVELDGPQERELSVVMVGERGQRKVKSEFGRRANRDARELTATRSSGDTAPVDLRAS